MNGTSTFLPDIQLKSSATVTVREDASGVRSDAGNLRLDVTLPGDVDWVTGLNVLSRDGLNSVDVQTGFQFERNAASGNVFSVIEYAQQRVQVLTPAEQDLVQALEEAGIEITDEFRESLGRFETQWRPNFKVGGKLAYSGINLLDGEAVLEASGEYRSADQSAEVSFTLRSVIPADNDDVDVDDILNPFDTSTTVLNGNALPAVDGLWAWNLAYNSDGITDLTATLNSPEYDVDSLRFSASVQQIAQWRETVVQNIQTTVGARVQANFGDRTNFSIEPLLEVDWMQQEYSHGITGRASFQATDDLNLAAQMGYKSKGVGLASVFARSDVTFSRDDYTLGAFARDEYQFADSSQLIGAGFRIEFEADDGLFEGIKVKLDGEFSRRFEIYDKAAGSVDDFSVSANVHLPF